MTSATFKLDAKKLEDMIANNPQKLAVVVKTTATRILSDARVKTPRDPARPPEYPDAYDPTGLLRAHSDTVRKDLVGLRQNVEYYMEYAPHQEFGAPAINLPKRPFLTPSVENNAKRFFEDIGKVIK